MFCADHTSLNNSAEPSSLTIRYVLQLLALGRDGEALQALEGMLGVSPVGNLSGRDGVLTVDRPSHCVLFQELQTFPGALVNEPLQRFAACTLRSVDQQKF